MRCILVFRVELQTFALAVTVTATIVVAKHSEKNYSYRKILYSYFSYFNFKVLILKIPPEFKNWWQVILE